MGRRGQRARGRPVPWVGGCGQTLTREQRCDISDFHREIAAIPTAEGRGAIKAGARRSGDGAVSVAPSRTAFCPPKGGAPPLPRRRLKVPAGRRAKGLKNTGPDTRSLKKPEAVPLSLFILFFHDGRGAFCSFSGSLRCAPRWLPVDGSPPCCPHPTQRCPQILPHMDGSGEDNAETHRQPFGGRQGGKSPPDEDSSPRSRCWKRDRAIPGVHPKHSEPLGHPAFSPKEMPKARAVLGGSPRSHPGGNPKGRAAPVPPRG